MSTQTENKAAEKTEQVPPPTQTSVILAPKREIRAVEDDSAIAYLMDTARFEHCYRIAGAMARASLIPKHLKGDSFEQTQANCFLVVNQALRWQLDPFSVAPETYEVGGKLGFQGKLIAAVINARGGLADKLSYTFDGTGDDLQVTVSGRLNGERQARTITVKVRDAKTTNSMWTKDPQQKLVYTGAIRWARRHKPEVILGVLTDDDAEAIREEARFIAARKTTPEPTAFEQSQKEPAKPRGRPPTEKKIPPATIAAEPPPNQQENPPGLEPEPESLATAGVGVGTEPPANGEFQARTGETEQLTNVRRLLWNAKKTEDDLIKLGIEKRFIREGQKLSDLTTSKHEAIIASFERLLPDMK